MNLNDLSKEDLLKMVLKLQKENESKDKQIKKLEAEKRKLNVELNKLIEKYEHKVEVNNKLIVERYLAKSEKLTPVEESINEAEFIIDDENNSNKTERKTPTKNFIEELKALKNKTIVEDFDFELNNIDSSKVKSFGEDVSYKIEIKPVDFEVVEIKRPKYKDKDYIYQSKSNDPFPHSPLTPSLAANIINMKYNLAVPLHRYAKYMNTFNLMVSPQDLSNYVVRTQELLEPLYKQLEYHLVNTKYKVIHGDETPLQVVDMNKKKSYMFVYTTSFWDDPIYIYQFSENRKIDKTVTLLNDYKGYFICDGYPGYDALPEEVNGEIQIQRCWVHMRRYFFDCLKSIKKENIVNSKAYPVVKKIDEMFKIEAQMRENEFTVDQIKSKRNSKEYTSLLKELDEMILSIDYGSSSYLKKAYEHYKNDKDELYTFLSNGYVDIHNNLCERTVRPFTIARRNFMFCKTSDGATVTGKLFSIVQTAKANGLRVEQYLKYVIERIEKFPIDDLLPWSDKLPDELKIKV